MRPRAKLYLYDTEAGGVFGDGRWRLLAAVHELGSIREAARALGRGYRKAWGDIKRAEEALGRRLVRKSRGGPSGGSTELTDLGRELLRAWERYRDDVSSSMGEAFERHLERIVEGSSDE